MKTNVSNWKKLILLLFVITMLPACSGSDKDEDDSSSNELLIGSWIEERQNIEWFEWTFRRDGTCDLLLHYNKGQQVDKDFENEKYTYNAQTQKLTIVYRDEEERSTKTLVADVIVLTKNKFQYRWLDNEDDMNLYSFIKTSE